LSCGRGGRDHPRPDAKGYGDGFVEAQFKTAKSSGSNWVRDILDYHAGRFVLQRGGFYTNLSKRRAKLFLPCLCASEQVYHRSVSLLFLQRVDAFAKLTLVGLHRMTVRAPSLS
jgi:hypothetical protein